MNLRRIVCFSVLLLGVVAAVHAEDKPRKGPTISDKNFRQISSTFLNDPLNKSARDWARLMMLYTFDTPSASIVLGAEEWRWAGLDTDDPRSLLLLAAYAAGNIQSQFNSGVKRNDRYSGLLTLFHVYRSLREQDEKFKIAAVDDLLALHEENKLVQHLQKLDEMKPRKWTPAQEAAVRRLMRNR